MFMTKRGIFASAFKTGRRWLQTFENHLEIECGTKNTSLYYFWLRDHCRCSNCYNRSTNQISYDVTSMPFEVKPKLCNETDQELKITWNDGHVSSYSLKWLKSLEFANNASRRQTVTWNRNSVRDLTDTTVSYDEYIASDEGVKKILQSVLKNGFAIVNNVQPTLEATKGVVEAIGFVQKTFFKEMHDLASGAQFSDTAYTNIPLGPHTDNTYFTEAAGLQVFHLLSHEGAGGETLLVDGFNAAGNIARTDPDAYRLLCEEILECEYIEPGVHYTSMDTVIKLHPYTKQLLQIRYNAYDRSPLTTLPAKTILPYYRAYRRFGVEVNRPDNQWWLKLQPGMVLFIDNWRVMHGRAAFTGVRRLGGCYMGRAEWLSKCKTLNLNIY